MPVRYLDPKRYGVSPVAADADADWSGNNAALHLSCLLQGLYRHIL